MSTPARQAANLPRFYEHLAKLMVVVNKSYVGVDEYCNKMRNLNAKHAKQKARILRNITKKLSSELGKLIAGRDHDIKYAVSILGSISRPSNADPLCVGEPRLGELPGDEGGRRTRRRHGRRRTQKKKA
jgi:hypothetical protein